MASVLPSDTSPLLKQGTIRKPAQHEQAWENACVSQDLQVSIFLAVLIGQPVPSFAFKLRFPPFFTMLFTVRSPWPFTVAKIL
jgi:hypothetical protein